MLGQYFSVDSHGREQSDRIALPETLSHTYRVGKPLASVTDYPSSRKRVGACYINSENVPWLILEFFEKILLSRYSGCSLTKLSTARRRTLLVQGRRCGS